MLKNSLDYIKRFVLFKPEISVEDILVSMYIATVMSGFDANSILHYGKSVSDEDKAEAIEIIARRLDTVRFIIRNELNNG